MKLKYVVTSVLALLLLGLAIFQVQATSASNKSPNEYKADTVDEIVAKTNRMHETYWTEGWLHFKTLEQSFIPNESLLPNGEKVPTQTAQEMWLLLDKKGYVQEAVQISDSGSEYTHQISFYKNGKWTNLSDHQELLQEKIKPELDFGFGQKVSQYGEKLKLDKRFNEIKGKEYTEYSIIGNSDGLVSTGKQKDGSDILVKGFKQALFFLPGSDAPSIAQAIRILPDGEEQLEYQVEILLVEQLQTIPANITQYLK